MAYGAVADSPSDRRRGKPSKPARAVKPAATEAEHDRGREAESAARDTAPSIAPAARKRFPFEANVIWALVTGLAIGFAVGREVHRLGPSDDTKAEADTAATPAFIAAESGGKKAYKSAAEFPAGWVKDTDLSNGPTLFAGLTDAQKVTVMQALNERDCTCGCGYGSLATCLHKDPGCPNSPAIAKMIVDLVKQGKGLDDILSAIDDRQKGGQKPAAAPAAEPPSTPKYIEIASHNPRLGPKEAKVTIVVFSDFQCPFCKRAVPTIKQIEETYGKDVAIVFRNQPLPFHDKAVGAALALQAANLQRKGWAMHDKMFENNTALAPEDLAKYAKDIGLDVAKFKKDMADPKLKEQVDADSKIANSVGASGTPTFFVNGRMLVGAQPFEKFKELIDVEIKEADALVKSGVPLGDVYKKRSQ